MHHHRTGRQVHVEYTTALVTMAGKELVLGVDRDITERVQAEEVLRSTNERLQLVIDTIPHYVFWKDHLSVYLGCNSAFARFAGLDRADEVIGKTDHDLVWREQAADHRADDVTVMEADEPKLGQVISQTRDRGVQVWLEERVNCRCTMRADRPSVCWVFARISLSASRAGHLCRRVKSGFGC